MLDINRTRRVRAVSVGILLFSFFGAQIWELGRSANDSNAYLRSNESPFVAVEAGNSECTSPRTMHALLYDLSTISVQLSIHEERNGIIISDPIQGLIVELHAVIGEDLCTDYSDLSQLQQQLYMEIEMLVYELKGLHVKARHLDDDDTQQGGIIS